MSNNVKCVQEIYAAFGRGDVVSILARVSDDTRWGFNGARPDVVPWHRPVAGRAELPGFFGALAENVEFSSFEPQRYIDGGDRVVVEVSVSYRVNRIGRPVAGTQLHA